MVGVAGKSTGCNTCRRRKVKCDATRPACERCSKSSVLCEGYERFPVFIDRTQAGLRKRRRLEEIKARSPLPLCTVSSPKVEEVRFISWFLDSFTRPPPRQCGLLTQGNWLDYFLKESPACPTFTHSMLAVSTTRLGKTVGRADLIAEGRRLYAQSLASTRKAIISSPGAVGDEVLATTCAMILYELFDSTSNDLKGWLQHLSGLADLLQSRDPATYASPPAHAIFEHSRYLIMLKHLFERKGSVFSQRTWLEEPWLREEKSVEQRVFDQGLKLASLLERCDAAVHRKPRMSRALELWSECMELQAVVETLLEKHIAPALRQEQPLPPVLPAGRRAHPNHTVSTMSITALGIQLAACDLASHLMHHIIKPSLTLNDVKRVDLASMRYLGESSIDLTSKCRRLAKLVVQQADRSLEERTSLMGSAKMHFSLQLAYRQISSLDPEYRQCQRLLQQLSRWSSTADAMLHSKARLIEENESRIGRQWAELVDGYHVRQGLSSPDADVMSVRPVAV